MNVAYSCNNSYISHTGISIISLLENNRDIDSINIYLISYEISECNIEILRKIIESCNRHLIVVDFNDICYDLKISSIGRHIATIYTKVFFSRIANLKKILYIDSDTIINGSLNDLWCTNLDGVYMGMVQTYTDSAKKELGVDENSLFFNDGVALVNVAFCRDNNLIEKIKDVILKFNGEPPVLSEGAINYVCENRITIINPKYNMMSGLYQGSLADVDYMTSILSYEKTELLEAVNNPVIIHYLAGFYNRPWFKSCTHPLKDRYLYYKSLSPWKEDKLLDENLPLKLRLIGLIISLIGLKNVSRVRKIKTHFK